MICPRWGFGRACIHGGRGWVLRCQPRSQAYEWIATVSSCPRWVGLLPNMPYNLSIFTTLYFHRYYIYYHEFCTIFFLARIFDAYVMKHCVSKQNYILQNYIFWLIGFSEIPFPLMLIRGKMLTRGRKRSSRRVGVTVLQCYQISWP